MEAREKKLAIVDYHNCQSKLIDNGVLSQNATMYSINTNIKSFASKFVDDDLTLNSPKLILNAKFITQDGNIVDTSDCNKIEVKLPTETNTPYINDYYKFKNNTDIDIYNSSHAFFNDICFSYSTNNNTDFTIKDRRNKYNVSYECSENCKYNGIDEHSYVSCSCDGSLSNISNTYSYVTSSVFNSIITSNYMLIKCFNNAFDINYIGYNIGFYLFLILSILWILIIIVYHLFYEVKILTNNYAQVIYNDAFDFDVYPDKNKLHNNTTKNKFNSNNSLALNNKIHISFNANEDQVYNKSNVNELISYNNINNPIEIGMPSFKKFDNIKSNIKNSNCNKPDLIKFDNKNNNKNSIEYNVQKILFKEQSSEHNNEELTNKSKDKTFNNIDPIMSSRNIYNEIDNTLDNDGNCNIVSVLNTEDDNKPYKLTNISINLMSNNKLLFLKDTNNNKGYNNYDNRKSGHLINQINRLDNFDKIHLKEKESENENKIANPSISIKNSNIIKRKRYNHIKINNKVSINKYF